ncbi:MAG: hypothetical protein AAGB35_10015 [Pseudomonadota bacterium]
MRKIRLSLIFTIFIIVFTINTSNAGGGGGGGGVAINWIVAFTGIAHGNDAKQWIDNTKADGTKFMPVSDLEMMLMKAAITPEDDDGKPLPHQWLTPEQQKIARNMFQAVRGFITDTSDDYVEHIHAYIYTTTDIEEQNTLYSEMHAKLYDIHTAKQEE